MISKTHCYPLQCIESLHPLGHDTYSGHCRCPRRQNDPQQKDTGPGRRSNQPPPFRGKRCEPGFVAYTAKVLAEIRGLEMAALEDLTSTNFRRLFRKMA